MSVSREVLLAGTRAYADRYFGTVAPRERERLAQVLANGTDQIGARVLAAIVAAVEADRAAPVPSALFDGCIPAQRTAYEPCGCLANDAGAHRVGCPAHPEGVRVVDG